MYIYLITELKNTWSKNLRELKEERDKFDNRQIYYHSWLFNTPLAVNDRTQRESIGKNNVTK